MSIYVTVEDAYGEQVSEALDIGRIQRHFKAVEDGACLRFVAENMDTVFNHLQNAQLASELRVIGEKLKKADEIEELSKLVKMCETAGRKESLFVKFYGDKVRE